MSSITSLLAMLNERNLAQTIGLRHDEARMRYTLQSNTVSTFDEFCDAIAHYYNYHYTNCVSNGGQLFSSEAASRAKELLEKEYRKRRSDIVGAFNDAHDGTNGGMRVILDTIADGLKAESVERYMRDVFDRHVAPNSWHQKVAIIRDFITQCGPLLAASIDVNNPERYAQNYNELISTYVESLQQLSPMFRRL